MNIAEFNSGGEFKDALLGPGGWTMGISAWGEILPYHENRTYLDKAKKDKWGLPVLAMDASLRETEKNMRKDMMEDAKEMLEVAGVKNVRTYDGNYIMGGSIHEMVTALMDHAPQPSALTKYNQVLN